MKGFNFNVSSLFGSLGSNNSFDFSNYSSIRNGSYGKMLKSYYAEQKKYASEKKDVENQINNEKNKYKFDAKKIGTVDKSLTAMKKEADGLKTAAEALAKDDLWKQTDGKYDVDKITDAIKNFANEYNDVISQNSKVSSKEVNQSTKYMTDLTNVMSKTLKKIGVTVGADGKMSVDEDALKKADMKSVKSLFNGASSYGNQTGERAGEISRATVMSGSMYSNNGALSNSFSSMFGKWI